MARCRTDALPAVEAPQPTPHRQVSRAGAVFPRRELERRAASRHSGAQRQLPRLMVRTSARPELILGRRRAGSVNHPADFPDRPPPSSSKIREEGIREMRKGVERWTATSTVVIGGAVLAVALYTRAGEARAIQAAPTQRVVATCRRSISKNRSSPSSRRTASSVTARTSERAACRWRRTATCSTAASGPVVRPGKAASSMLLARGRGVLGDQMPNDALPLTAGEVALVGRGSTKARG